MKKTHYFLAATLTILLTGCVNGQINSDTDTSGKINDPDVVDRPSITVIDPEIDEKFFCNNEFDCVDGEYCAVTEPDGCVNADWWWENVGNEFDCEPDPTTCGCNENKCEKIN